MEAEVWHTHTNEHIGMVEIAVNLDEPGQRVAIKTKRPIHHATLGDFNAIEMIVFRMTAKDKTKYLALETNLPMKMLKLLEGFSPRVRIPTLSEIFHINRTVH